MNNFIKKDSKIAKILSVICIIFSIIYLISAIAAFVNCNKLTSVSENSQYLSLYKIYGWFSIFNTVIYFMMGLFCSLVDTHESNINNIFDTQSSVVKKVNKYQNDIADLNKKISILESKINALNNNTIE